MPRVIDHEKTSKKIRECMDDSNLTPKDLMEILPLANVQTVYKWIDANNKTIPRIDTVVRLTEIFHVDQDDLIITKQV